MGLSTEMLSRLPEYCNLFEQLSRLSNAEITQKAVFVKRQSRFVSLFWKSEPILIPMADRIEQASAKARKFILQNWGPVVVWKVRLLYASLFEKYNFQPRGQLLSEELSTMCDVNANQQVIMNSPQLQSPTMADVACAPVAVWFRHQHSDAPMNEVLKYQHEDMLDLLFSTNNLTRCSSLDYMKLLLQIAHAWLRETCDLLRLLVYLEQPDQSELFEKLLATRDFDTLSTRQWAAKNAMDMSVCQRLFPGFSFDEPIAEL